MMSSGAVPAANGAATAAVAIPAAITRDINQFCSDKQRQSSHPIESHLLQKPLHFEKRVKLHNTQNKHDDRCVVSKRTEISVSLHPQWQRRPFAEQRRSGCDDHEHGGHSARLDVRLRVLRLRIFLRLRRRRDVGQETRHEQPEPRNGDAHGEGRRGRNWCVKANARLSHRLTPITLERQKKRTEKYTVHPAFKAHMD